MSQKKFPASRGRWIRRKWKLESRLSTELVRNNWSAIERPESSPLVNDSRTLLAKYFSRNNGLVIRPRDHSWTLQVTVAGQQLYDYTRWRLDSLRLLKLPIGNRQAGSLDCTPRRINLLTRPRIDECTLQVKCLNSLSQTSMSLQCRQSIHWHTKT